MEERWIINKLGLFNFWYYDDQEFELSDGKIIFRGTNGSGKSVTTQSFIPLLLDGDTSPERLDPFGSNARKIDNYLLLGKDEEERISYLYMEFMKAKSNTCITIGMGFKAREGKKSEIWYFILKDGRRINHDFKLYKNCGDKYPLTCKQLQNALGEGNIFTKDQKEYMEKVNEHLYGYYDMESYSDLLKLLIEVRSPKLSKDFKPTVVYDILKESLSTLEEDDLRNIAEAMDNMDSINVKLINISKTIESGKKIAEVFDNYNKSKILDKAKLYSDRKSKILKLEDEIKELRMENNFKKDILSNKIYDLVALKDDLYKGKIKEKTLRGNKGFVLKNEMYEMEISEKELLSELKRKEALYNEKLNYKNRIQNDYAIEEKNIFNLQKEFKDLIKNEHYLRKEIYFHSDSELQSILNMEGEDTSNEILNNIDGYDAIVRNNYKILCRYEDAFNELSLMEEVRENKKIDIKVQENKFTESLKYLTNVKNEYIEKINLYLEKSNEFKMKEDELIALFKAVNKIEYAEDCTEIGIQVFEAEHKLKEDILNKRHILERRLDNFEKQYLNCINDKTKEFLKSEFECIELEKDGENVDNKKILRNKKTHACYDEAEEECALTIEKSDSKNLSSEKNKGKIIELPLENTENNNIYYRKNNESHKDTQLIKIKELKADIDNLNRRYELLKEETKLFPDLDDIKASIKLIDESYNLLSKEKTMFTGIEDRYLQLKKSYDELKLELFEGSEYIKIPKSTKEYEKVIKDISEYKRIITECIIINSKIRNIKEVLKTFDAVLKNSEHDMDNIYKDILNLKDKINKMQIEMKSLNDVMKTLDIDKVEKEYKHVVEIINSYPEIIEHKQIEKVRLEEIIKKENDNILKKEEKLKKEKVLLDLNKKIVMDEIGLGYFDKKNTKKEDELFEEAILQSSYVEGNNDENLLTVLYDCLSKYGKDLEDYNLRVEDIFNDYLNDEDEEKNYINKQGIRLDIRTSLNKKSISIYTLLEYLEEILKRENNLMGNKEREIFEDVLVSTLSTKIYAKIHKASAWVKLINDFMEKMDTSNGLKFSLRWVPKRAQRENEMDIYDLTNILRCNHVMSEEEKRLISKHFKEKLKKKKRSIKGEKNYRNYMSIIKDVLDYREWFEFKLFFKKPLEDFKELTDNEFFKLSGGEKAMAMYVPLFAAVNARYNAAGNKDCPRVIALDEAFAGVDEENIGSMFELIENLNLDYILNSQVLWGTYSSVKSLSIYELIRLDDHTVAPIRYTWNGQMKTMKI